MSNQKKNKNLPNLGKAYEEINTVYRNVPTGNLLGLNQPAVEAEAEAEAPPSSSNLEGLFNAVGSYQAGIFLDNDEGHRSRVRDMCLGRFRVPMVNETHGFRGGVPVNSPQYLNLLLSLSEQGKEAAKLLSRLCLSLGGGIEAYDTRSGLNQETVQEIVNWVNENQGKGLVAVFDFDRTLSVMEGGFFLGDSIQEMKKTLFEAETVTKLANGTQVSYLGGKKIPQDFSLRPHIPGFTVEGFANYLAGGTERMTMLQGMFDHLYQNNVKVFLLTNNTRCPQAKNLFREITMIYTRGRPVDVICGAEFGGDKGRAIVGKNTNTGNLKALRGLCLAQGGGKRKSRKQKKSKSKQTRRR